MESVGGKFDLNIITVDAKARFLSKLAGVSDPEQKRKIIGNEFVYVFDDGAAKLAAEEGVSFPAEGNLYTGGSESGTETAQKIK
ncbi:GMP synthase (glutamine-hydrolyzing), partial [Enterococcus faecalis]|nr:GMP synthase (glutamine-hydrolyzing) [Enterococcus faecalis]